MGGVKGTFCGRQVILGPVFPGMQLVGILSSQSIAIVKDPIHQFFVWNDYDDPLGTCPCRSWRWIKSRIKVAPQCIKSCFTVVQIQDRLPWQSLVGCSAVVVVVVAVESSGSGTTTSTS